MNLNRASVYFIGAFLAGLLLVTPHELTAFAEVASSHEISAIEQNDVVYLGENHDSTANHRQQLAIITQLHQSKANSDRELVIGLEMFQRPFQPVLNRYLEARIDESELIAQSEYENRWGFDWEFYAPIRTFR